MTPFPNTRSVLRYAATVAFSIFSYAVMAQSAPTTDACGHVLSAFQKHLYNRYLAGPDSLREFVFSVRGVHLMDVYEADAWARGIDAQVCPAADRTASMAGTADAAPDAPPMTRAEVRQELALARSSHQLPFGDR